MSDSRARPGRGLIRVVLLGGLLAVAFAAAGPPGFSRSVTPGLVARFERLFAGAGARLEGWRAFVREARARHGTAEPALLAAANGFVNRLPAVTDQEHWRAEDYWATPAESVASSGADCEDFAIAKYFALKELGLPAARLRMVYVWAGQARSAHMVLAYYPAPEAEPLILDNLDGSIRRASERPDLVPVYSFNDEDLLVAAPGAAPMRVSATSNRKWRNVVAKLERELTY